MEVPRFNRFKKQRYALVGEQCPECKTKIFPPRDICTNTECNRIVIPIVRELGIGTVVGIHEEVIFDEKSQKLKRSATAAIRMPNGREVVSSIDNPFSIVEGSNVEVIGVQKHVGKEDYYGRMVSSPHQQSDIF
jgi:uncharacterized OB-fold protein